MQKPLTIVQERRPSRQFIIQPCDELSIVIDSTSGRPVSRGIRLPEAEEYCAALNFAVGRGRKSLARVLCDEPETGNNEDE